MAAGNEMHVPADIPLTTVSMFWWKGRPNWGDALSPLILRHFSHLDVTHAPPERCEVVCIGSLIGNLIRSSYLGTIIGSGKLFEESEVPHRARVLALRGPLTAKGVSGNFVLGDPGLIVDGLVDLNTKEYNLGIVPHWSELEPPYEYSATPKFIEKSIAHDPLLLKYKPTIINPFGDPLDVVRQIGSCRKVVSSSLHGLIVADAFSIPRRFEPTANWKKEGGDFKLRDYNESVGLTTFEPGQTMQANWNKVTDLKCGLYDVFNYYRSIVELQSP